MTRNRKKRQQSSVDRLPADIHEKLLELLQDPRVTDLAATKKINEILEAEGVEQRLSKSAVNRFSIKMHDVGRAMEEAREISKMWIGKLGSEPAGEVGKLVNEMVRTHAFRVALKASESDEDIDPKTLKTLAISVHRLEQAAEKNAKVEEQIREKAIKDVAEQVDAETRASGAMTAERFREIIKEQYGV